MVSGGERGGQYTAVWPSQWAGTVGEGIFCRSEGERERERRRLCRYLPHFPSRGDLFRVVRINVPWHQAVLT